MFEYDLTWVVVWLILTTLALTFMVLGIAYLYRKSDVLTNFSLGAIGISIGAGLFSSIYMASLTWIFFFSTPGVHPEGIGYPITLFLFTVGIQVILYFGAIAETRESLKERNAG